MDGEPENELKNDTERVVSADLSNEEDSYPMTVNEKEGSPAERAASDQDEDNSGSMKSTEEAPVEAAATSKPEENSRHELPGVDNSTTSEDLDVKISEANEQATSLKERGVFERHSHVDSGPSRLHAETPTQEEEEDDEAEEKGSTTAHEDKEYTNYEEHMQLLQELCEERDKASQHSSQLQMKLAEYFRKKAGNDSQLDREMPASDQQQEYEKYRNVLTDLKQQLAADSESAQQQAEQLSLQCQEKLDMVEREWQAFVALKRDVAARALGPGKPAARAGVESTLAAEQRRQDELIRRRLEHIKLGIESRRLEAELHGGEDRTMDPLKRQFKQLQAERLELKKHAEKQSEELLERQEKISSSLELLSNVKEKLFWSQMEVQAKREQLSEAEAALARKRERLTRTRQARGGLQRDNLRLKEGRGLLGNRVLLQDFEDTVDAADLLEGHLESLKGRRAELVFSCGRRKKTPGTDSAGSRRERK